jgi:multiple sugar transport system permease protein
VASVQTAAPQQPPVVRRVAPPIPRRRPHPGRGVRYAILIAGAILFVAPFAYMMTASFQPQDRMFQYPPEWIPLHPTLANYKSFFTGKPYGTSQDFGRWIVNSAIVAGSLTVLQVFFNSLSAYVFAKRRFPGRDIIFLAFLATMMIPGQVTIVPFYLILKHIPLFGGNDIMGVGGHGWLDSYWGMILPRVASPFSIFLMRQYMRSIPDELLDAARIDGASEFTIYRKVIMPLSMPVIAATAIFAFQYFWDEFYYPLIIISSPQMYTLPLGLALFSIPNRSLWTLIMAGSVLATLPVLIVFLVFQRYFIRGITLTGPQ